MVNIARYSNSNAVLNLNYFLVNKTKILPIFCNCAIVGHFKEITVAQYLLIKLLTALRYFPITVPAEVYSAQK